MTAAEPVIVEHERTLTRAELDGAVEQTASLLAAHGAGPHGRVGWMMGNRAEALVVALAARALSAPVVAFGQRCTAEELVGRVRVATPSVIVADAEARDRLGAATEGIPLIDVDGASAGAVPRRRRNPAPSTDRLGAGASLLFTSGTSGSPKAALRSRGDARLAEAIADGFGIGKGTRFLASGPLSHSGPWTCSLMTLARGGCVGLLRRCDADEWLRFAADHAMNSGFLTPTQLRRLVTGRAAGHPAPLPPLSHVIVSGEPFADDLKRAAVEVFGPGFVECYGCTELGPLTALHADEFGRRPGSCGRPFAGVEVAAFRGRRRLRAGERGVLYARTPLAFDGYVGGDGGPGQNDAGDAPGAGWATVRDVGFVDADGYVYVTGRADEMIISGGVNVFPEDVEDVVRRHPDVRDCAVLGLPDPEWGQRIVAALVCDRDIDVAELRAWLHGRISDDKRPRTVLRVPAIPVTGTDKKARRALAESLRSRFVDASAADLPGSGAAPERRDHGEGLARAL
jgi:acyl-CoA synthetase (AMP-forming)/AMP-acid ligase II